MSGIKELHKEETVVIEEEILEEERDREEGRNLEGERSTEEAAEQPKAKERKERKERRDKGSLLLTPRDLATLRWIGEQYGVRVDQLQQLLGREPQRETKAQGIVAPGTALRVLDRWRRGGYVESRKLFLREPAWVWLTRKGLAQLGLTYRYWEPNVTTLQHVYWTNQVRLYVERRRGSGVLWKSERTLKPESQRAKGKHYADAEIEIEEHTIAVEVELTLKRPADTIGIMQGLAEQYSTIWYFTLPATKNGVQQCISALPEKARRRFKIYDLADTL